MISLLNITKGKMGLKRYKDEFEEYTYYLKDGNEVKHGSLSVDGTRIGGTIKSEGGYKDGAT